MWKKDYLFCTFKNIENHNAEFYNMYCETIYILYISSYGLELAPTVSLGSWLWPQTIHKKNSNVILNTP